MFIKKLFLQGMEQLIEQNIWEFIKIMEQCWVVYSVITELLLKPATTVSKKTSFSQVVCVMMHD